MALNNRNCCVFGCTSRKGKSPNLSFHKFPSVDRSVYIENNVGIIEKVSQRKVWINKLKIVKPVTESMRVCSLHFTKTDFIGPDVKKKKHSLVRYAVPSCKLPEMPCKCSVPSCNSNYTSNNEGYITVFQFPRDEELKQKWLRNIPRKNWKPTRSSVVCIKHFEKESLVFFDIYKDKNGSVKTYPRKRPCLKENAVPKLFPESFEEETVEESNSLRKTKKKCCVPGCTDSISRQFRFPNPKTGEKVTFNSWLKVIKNDDLLKLSAQTIHKKYMVCGKHFLPEDKVEVGIKGLKKNIRGLKKNTIPSLFLPSGSQNNLNLMEDDIVFTLLVEDSSDASTSKPDQVSKFSPEGETSKQHIQISDIPDKPRKNKKTVIKTEKVPSESNEVKDREIKTETLTGNLETQEKKLGTIKLLNEEGSDFEENFIIQDSELSPNTASNPNCDVDNYTKLAYENVLLKLKFDKLLDENNTIKNNFVYLTNESEILKNENKTLKYKIDQLGKRNLLENGSDIENVIDLTDMKSICRICLQNDENLIFIKDMVELKNPHVHSISILNALLSMGLDSIELGDHMPDKICPKCYEHLKLFVTFKYNYDKSSDILKLYMSGIFKDVKKEENVDLKNIVENSEYIQTSDDENDNFYYKNKLIKQAKNMHTCPICFKELKLSQFRPHIHKHKGFKKYLDTSSIVSKKTKFYALPDKKNSLVNEEKKLHQCPFCPEKMNATDFLLHADNHMRNDQFTCDKCERIFRKRSFLVQHMLVHEKELPYSCATCKKRFVVKKNYEYHLLTHSYKHDELPYKCELCERTFANPIHLARHKIIHSEERPYSSKYNRKRCQYCMQNFASTDLLMSHRCVTKGVRLSVCRVCNKSFSSLKMYYYHMRVKHKIMKNRNSQICKECDKIVNNITYHRMRAHPNSVRKALCSVCGLYVINISSHRLKHEPRTCKTCDKKFTHPTALKKHMLIHTGQKPFLCSSCPKTFNCKYNLQVHERIHLGEKPHVCQICQKGFLEKSYLKKHMKVHIEHEKWNFEET